MAIQGLFYGLPASTLQTMLGQWQACLTAIATTGQSYSIAGRAFTRADIQQVAQMIAEIQSAIDRAAGNRTTRTWGYFSSDYPGANSNGP